MGPPSLAGGLQGIWNRIPISCAFVWTRLGGGSKGVEATLLEIKTAASASAPVPLPRSDLKTTFKLLSEIKHSTLYISQRNTLPLWEINFVSVRDFFSIWNNSNQLSFGDPAPTCMLACTVDHLIRNFLPIISNCLPQRVRMI